MSTIGHDNETSLADFAAGWDTRLQENEQLPVGVAVLVLTSFGERPVPSTRLAKDLGRPVSEAEARAQGHCSTGAPAEDGIVRVEDGLITYINPERTIPAPRRVLQIGDRRFGMTGCAPDVFLYAAAGPTLPPSGGNLPGDRNTHPDRVHPRRCRECRPRGRRGADTPAAGLRPARGDESLKDIDASFCAQCPFYSSAKAAHRWLAAHPGGRVFPVRDAWDLSFHRLWRDRMSALLNPGN